MKVQSILLLLLSLLLGTVTAWSLTTFLRLQSGYNTTSDSTEFKNKCNITKSYINTGKITSITLVIVSVIVIILTSINLARTP